MAYRLLATVLAVLVVACATEPLPPASLDTRADACRFCRMTVSDRRLASQIVAPYEEPRFFDGLGCLANYLATSPSLPSRAIVYVTDHRSGAWIPAERAVYARVESRLVPMGVPIVAYDTEASRAADRDTAAGPSIALRDVFPTGLAGGAK